MRITVLLAMTLLMASEISAQQQRIGLAPVDLAGGPFTFDTAEVPAIKVSALAWGMPQRTFALALLPGGDLLISERGGNLRVLRFGKDEAPWLDPQPVPGLALPAPAKPGCGLMDIELHPDFAANQWLYFTYNTCGDIDPTSGERVRNLSSLTLYRARFDGTQLSNVEVLFAANEFASSSGSRITFVPPDYVLITTGAPYSRLASTMSSIYGKVLRLHDNGEIPTDNPFAGDPSVHQAIYAYGFRDQLGITVHPASGEVYAIDHGPNGGDEVNHILPGRNYGWPDYSFGRHYEGPRVSALPLAEGVEQGVVSWLPSIGPAGMMFYTGSAFPAWQGNLFVGSARRGQINGTGGLERLVFDDEMRELRRETLLVPLRHRVRDMVQGTNGEIYILTDRESNAVLVIEPAVD